MQQSGPLLTIAVSTIDTRILALEPGALPTDPRFAYRFYVQRVSDAGEQERVRAHIETLVGGSATVAFLAGTGLAASRNAAIAEVETPFIQFCDDDLALDGEGLAAALDYLANHDRLDVVWCRSAAPGGALRKGYPVHETRLSVLNSGGVGSPELMLRTASIRRHGLHFDERFGAGSQFSQGEEYIFLADLLRAGGHGVHLDRVLFEHEIESSGTRAVGREGLATRAAVLERVFGRLALPYKLAYVARHRTLYSGIGDVASFLTRHLSRAR